MKTCQKHKRDFEEFCPLCHLEKRASGSLQPDGSAALVREQDAANELYQAACCLMRYKEADQWHNLENAAHRFNAARQSRINDEIMRQNDAHQPQPPTTRK